MIGVGLQNFSRNFNIGKNIIECTCLAKSTKNKYFHEIYNEILFSRRKIRNPCKQSILIKHVKLRYSSRRKGDFKTNWEV